MSTNPYILQVGSIQAVILRKPIKNLHLSVLPPEGKVRISSPLATKDDTIRMLIATKIPWIRKQKAKFEGQERQTHRDYISGESHYFLGKRYRLEISYINEPPLVKLKGNRILLQVRPRASRKRRENVMMEWYRNELKALSGDLLNKWQNKVGAEVSSWGIRRMKTRWGSCNQKTRRILINLELAKKPINYTEYIVVHELVHLIEKKHNERFMDLMTKYLPQWRSRKVDLNRFILAHEEWNY